MSGDVSDGPMVFCQRICPTPAENATTFPSRTFFVLHGGLFRKAAYTVPCLYGPSAGDAATQRFVRYFHARLPVSMFTATNLPEFVEKYRRPKPIAGGNSTRLPAPYHQIRRYGGRIPSVTARVCSVSKPYCG